MKRFLIIALLLFVTFRAMAAEEELKIEAAWGTLRGTLWLPDAASNTALVIVAGSGPTDRYGNSSAGIRTQAYAQLAHELSAAGYAVLSYDKRGIAASQYHNREQMLSDCHFTYFADDIELWIKELQQRGYHRIFLAGHSEGAKLSLIVAARNPEVAGVVSLCGPAYPIDEILKVQLAGQLLAVDYALYARACQIIDTLKRGETPEEIPAAFSSLFPAYLNSFYHEDMACDPRREAARLRCPLLVVGGGRDVQVSTKNAHALKEACPQAELVIFEQMAHVLKDSEGRTAQEQLDAYTNPNLPLTEGLCEAIINFLKSH